MFLRQTLHQCLGGRGPTVALLHQVGDIHLQLLGQIGERPELFGASRPDVRGERMGWFVLFRHERPTPSTLSNMTSR